MSVKIQLRRDTASNWANVNPTLAQGEMGVELDTNKFKFGNGTTAWNSLPYAGGGSGDIPTKLSQLSNDVGFITISDVEAKHYALQSELPTKTSQLTNDSNYITLTDVQNDGYTKNKGTVTSVNNTTPNAQGNVTIDIPDEVTETTVTNWGFTKNEGTVKSVNGNTPDAQGNVTIEAGDGSVKTVNDVEPDANGNVELDIPSKTSDLTNDSDFLTATVASSTYPKSDETPLYTDSAFELVDPDGNMAFQIDNQGNIKTKAFDSRVVGSLEEYDIEYALRNGTWGESALTWHPNYVCNYTRIKGPFKVAIGQGYVLYNAWEYDLQDDSDFTNATKILEDSTSRLSFEYTGTKYVGLNLISSTGIGSELTILEPLYAAISSLTSTNITENKKKEDKVKAIRNAIFLGDSITHGVYSYYKNGMVGDSYRYCSWYWNRTYKTMPDYFSEYSGACVNNAAARGSGYVIQGRYSASGNNVSGNGPFYGNMLNKIQQYNFSNYDFVGIFQGINDYLQQASLGTFPTSGSPVQGTVTGNLALTIQKIITDNPLCKIVIYSPYNSWGQVAKGDSSTGGYVSNETYGDFAGDYALGYKKSAYTLAELIEAIDKVCKYYHIEHVKLSESNICNRLSIKEIMIEGLHSSLESMPKLAAEVFADKGYGE